MEYTIQEQIEILEAYERGEEIEVNISGWLTIGNKVNYQFDFQHYNYRIKKRCRAEKGGVYYYINSSFEVLPCNEDYDCVDDYRFNAGNYFRATQQAEKAKELLKECLIKFHEEQAEKAKELLKEAPIKFHENE